jgi:hypothetical protein
MGYSKNPLHKRETLLEYNYRVRQEAIELLKKIKDKKETTKK